MSARIACLSAAILTVLTGCPSDGGSRGQAVGCGHYGAITDLSKEPNYSANYLHRWTTRDGCGVRLDYLMRREGADACGGAAVADILMGWPLGTSSDENARIFVRDPENVFGDEVTSEAFEGDAALPKRASDSGFRDEESGAQLWMVGDDDSFLYLVFDDHVERWPLDESPAGCG